MKDKVLEIVKKVSTNLLTPEKGTDLIMELLGDKSSFIIFYKDEGFPKMLTYETLAADDVEAVDNFWKTHDVLATIVKVQKMV